MNLDRIFEIVFGVFSPQFFAAFPERVSAFLDMLRPYSTAFSLLFLTGIVYCFFRLERIIADTYHHDRVEEGEGAEGAETAALHKDKESSSAMRWRRIEEHMGSSEESDWRLAILEADVLLDEMVTNMGYRGDSLGEKLKGIEKSDFTTIDKAWEAHGVRNRIAHEGAAFALTEREAKRVISLYEEVFKESHFI